MSNQDNSEKLKLLYRFKELYFIVPILIYVIGFVYTQGSLSFFKKSTMLTDGLLPIYPISNEIYIIRGLYIALGLIIPILGLSLLITGWLRKKIKYKFKNPGIAVYYLLVAILLTFGNIKFFDFPYMDKILSIIFIFIFLIQFQIIISLYQKKRNSMKTLGEHGEFIFCYALVIMTLLISVYFLGQFTQQNKINKYFSGKSNIRIATIQMDSSNLSTYIMIDLTKDLFIGYDKNGNYVVIPMSKIKEIEISDSK